MRSAVLVETKQDAARQGSRTMSRGKNRLRTIKRAISMRCIKMRVVKTASNGVVNLDTLFYFTERGIAINPARKDLKEKLSQSRLPIRRIDEIHREVLEICGGPPSKPAVSREDVVAIVNWVDGTVLDSVFQIDRKK